MVNTRRSSFVFFNGPPDAGKDTLAKRIYEEFEDSRELIVTNKTFAHPLKSGCHVLLGLDPNPDYYDLRKNEPLEEFGGRTPRSFYQHMAENVMKPMFGKGIYGRAIANELSRIKSSDTSSLTEYNPLRLVQLTDLGFHEELEEIAYRFVTSVHDRPNVPQFVVVRVHRKGRDYSMDTRSYIEKRHIAPDLQAHVEFVDIDNDGDVDEAVKTTLKILQYVQ